MDDKTSESRVGLPPGSLIYIGDNTDVPIHLSVYLFETGERREYQLEQIDEVTQLIRQGKKIWVHLSGLHDPSIIAEFGKAAELPELILEDILNTEHPPSFDFYEQTAICLTKILHGNAEEDNYLEDHFSVVIKANLLFSFQETNRSIFEPIYRRLKNPTSRLRQRNVDYLGYALLDTVADSLLENVRKIRDQIEELEDEFYNDPDQDMQNQIHSMRGSLSELRKVIWPLRDSVAKIATGDYRGIDKKTLPYFRDVLDHLNNCSMILDSNRDLLTNLREWQLGALSTKMNQVMKVLTIIATIFIPLTFVAGIYGMNFRHMPELEWPMAYPALLIFMTVLAVAMLVYFKMKKWF
jgi:magnesium transporter